MALATRTLSYTGVEFLFREDDSSSDGEDIDNTNENTVYDEFALAIQNALCANILSNVNNVLQRDDESVSITEQISKMQDTVVEQICEVDEEATKITRQPLEMTQGQGDETVSEEWTERNTEETHVERVEDAIVPTQTVNKETETLSHTEQTFSVGRKKRPSRKERYHKRERTYKQVDPSEFGFHLSFIPRLVIPTTELDSGEDESQTAADTATPPTTTAATTTTITTKTTDDPDLSGEPGQLAADQGLVLDSDSAQNESDDIKDDETFFAELGIDIHDCGGYYDDEFLDWDGLKFSASKVTPKPEQPSKSKPVPKKTTSPHVPKNQQSATPTNIQRKESSTAKQKSKHKQTDQLEVISVPNYKMSTREQILFLELECHSGRAFYIRQDRHRKVLKAHKAVKTPLCMLKNIINNLGRKKTHMNHRLLKKSAICTEFRFQSRSSPSPMPNGVDLKVAREIGKANRPVIARAPKPPAPQNLNHVLHETNTPTDFSLDLVGFLMSIQNRDLTPEDYDMLLRLDDTVKAKTVSTDVLQELKTETVGPDIANILVCVICMEPYLEGQIRKFLPCEHDFHSNCIDSWLANSSQNCPLDGLPIVNS